jgi:(Z)-2-((N-methylformamido)methylene)-5-hydroxybutyrolactone dehydrogenase
MHFAARACRVFAGFADKIFGETIPLDQRDFSETSYFVDD